MGLHPTLHSDQSMTNIDSFNPEFDLICKLLAGVLVDEQEELIVSVKSEDFFYKPTSSLQFTGLVNITIQTLNVKQTGHGTEFTIKARASTHQEKRYFSLFFFLEKRDIPVRNIVGKTMLLQFPQTADTIHDSLFSLSLTGKNGQGSFMIGHGRGFLAFNN